MKGDNNMFKKIISFVLLIVMMTCSFTCFANTQDAVPTSNGVATVYTLSLKDAIDMAISQSVDLECWEVNMENYNIQLTSARRTQKENKNTPVYMSQNFELNYVKSGYYVEAAKSQISLHEIDYHRIVSTI